MDSLHAIYLALLQGFTEFLPISSSAHLILLPRLFGWEDQGLAFDVAVHVGSLAAVMSYFRREVKTITLDWSASVATGKQVGDSKLGWAVLWGTVPLGLAGLLFNGIVEQELRSPLVIAATTIGFGLLLWYSDIAGKRNRNVHSIQWKDIILIGLAQAIALIPGTSRSGITMTAGLMLGLSRESAAKFSFLLSIPAIILAGLFHSYHLYLSPVPVDWASLWLGILVSGVMAYTCIHLFLKMLEQMGMWPFVVYRLLLGGLLLYIFV